MEVKKSVKANLENKKGLFLEIGLVVSLALMILMFSYSQKERVVEDLGITQEIVEVDLVEVTIQEEKKIEPPKVQTVQVASEILEIVKDDVEITTEFDFNAEFSESTVVVAKQVEVVEEVVEEDAPFIRAEQMPKFQGKGGDEALQAFRAWVQSKLNYPMIAQENGIDGTVVLEFVVERDGSVSSIVVQRSPDRSLSDEASRVVGTSPKWEPGKQRGQTVRIKYYLPIQFVLQ